MLEMLHKSFNTKDDVRQAVQEKAASLGFEVVTGNSSSRSVRLTCIHYGECRRRIPEENRKRFRESRKLGCPWYLKAGYSKKKGGKWVISRIYGQKEKEREAPHNHPMTGTHQPPQQIPQPAPVINMEERFATVMDALRKKFAEARSDEEKLEFLDRLQAIIQDFP
ncbi:hypothetical protein DFQ28_001480 [Apophysomyces sp. BC1034]|nr:hypothetical protein DFQ30_001922 [Apophysomyces sp. BC1015]KAG0180164.1 hypothetical protein DFQ29_001142 [Apophysomyces sp. BC1021]KAG0190818.1 hypothetical protein DFQ28_001480 [Apophysomyces sp. BC1034]